MSDKAKIDWYMPFAGDDFFMTTDCMGAEFAQAFLKLRWHYWSRNRCVGLLNDPVLLQNISRIHPLQWESFSKMVFNNDENFFVQRNGLWHHDATKKQYEHALKVAQANRERASKGGKAKAANWEANHA